MFSHDNIIGKIKGDHLSRKELFARLATRYSEFVVIYC